jgi:four helix bundle protein
MLSNNELMQKPQSFKDLDVYLLAKDLIVKVHKLTIDELPKFEMYEEGSQLRRCSKSIVSNIVEGFGRRRYKNDFIQFLTYAIASCDETKVHLEILHETGSLKKELFEQVFDRYEELGAKLFNFREAVIKGHRTS